MQKNLIQLQPKLKIAAEKTQVKMVEVELEKKQADTLKESISVEESIVQKAVDEANAIKEDCERELADAIPALNAAQEALDCLRPEDLNLLKAMKSPP